MDDEENILGSDTEEHLQSAGFANEESQNSASSSKASHNSHSREEDGGGGGGGGSGGHWANRKKKNAGAREDGRRETEDEHEAEDASLSQSFSSISAHEARPASSSSENPKVRGKRNGLPSEGFVPPAPKGPSRK